MADFQIRINTQATGDGVRKTADDLKQLNQATDQASQSSNKFEDAFAKVARRFAGIGALISFATTELKAFFSVFTDLAAKGAAKSVSFDPLITQLETVRLRAAEVKAALGEVNDKLKEVATNANSLDVGLNKNLNAEDRQLRVDQAKLQLEKTQRKQGITDPTALAKIDLEFEEKGRQLALDAEARKAGAIQNASRLAQAQAAGAYDKLPAEQKKLVDMQRDAEQRKRDHATMLADLPALEKELEAAQNMPSFEERMLYGASLGLGGATLTPEQAAARDPDTIRENIRSIQKSRDTFAADEKKRQAEIDAQSKKVGQLTATATSGNRFAPQAESAALDLGANRTIAGYSTQSENIEFSNSTNLASAELLRQAAQALEQEEAARYRTNKQLHGRQAAATAREH